MDGDDDDDDDVIDATKLSVELLSAGLQKRHARNMEELQRLLDKAASVVHSLDVRSTAASAPVQVQPPVTCSSSTSLTPAARASDASGGDDEYVLKRQRLTGPTPGPPAAPSIAPSLPTRDFSDAGVASYLYGRFVGLNGDSFLLQNSMFLADVVSLRAAPGHRHARRVCIERPAAYPQGPVYLAVLSVEKDTWRKYRLSFRQDQQAARPLPAEIDVLLDTVADFVLRFTTDVIKLARTQAVWQLADDRAPITDAAMCAAYCRDSCDVSGKEPFEGVRPSDGRSPAVQPPLEGWLQQLCDVAADRLARL